MIDQRTMRASSAPSRCWVAVGVVVDSVVEVVAVVAILVNVSVVGVEEVLMVVVRAHRRHNPDVSLISWRGSR
jgi:hypothetical protein